MQIADYVAQLVDKGIQGIEIAEKLGVSVSMVSSYKGGSYNPSITVAKRIFTTDGIVFHPFSKSGLQLEIAKDKR